MAVKVGINGFGRIGRNVVRAGLNNPNVEFVAANDLTDTKTLAHLLKYDSILGPLHEEVKVDGDSISVNGKKIKIFAIKDPGEIDWSSVGAEIVVESTGKFTDATAQARLDMTPHMNVVQSKLDAARAKLQEVADATDEKWDDVMKGADHAWHDFKSAVEGAYDALKPHKTN